VYAASDALAQTKSLHSTIRAADRLRRIAPEQSMLPALDAKIARMKTIKRLECDFEIKDDR